MGRCVFAICSPTINYDYDVIMTHDRHGNNVEKGWKGRGVETNERLSRIQIPKNMVEVRKYHFLVRLILKQSQRSDIFVFANFIMLDVLQHSKISRQHNMQIISYLIQLGRWKSSLFDDLGRKGN